MVNQSSTVVNNLQDLQSGGLNFKINTGVATYTYFMRSLDPTILMLQPKPLVGIVAPPFLPDLTPICCECLGKSGFNDKRT